MEYSIPFQMYFGESRSLFFFCVFFCLHIFPKQVRHARRTFSQGWEGTQTRCVNCCARTGARIVISICIDEGYTLYHVAFL